MFVGLVDRFQDRGELRHADTGDDPRGTDRAWANADLDRIGAGVDQGLGRLGGGHVAGQNLNRIRQFLDPPDHVENLLGMAVRRVDNNHVNTGIDKAFGAGIPLLIRHWLLHATRRRPCASFDAFGFNWAFSISFTVIRPMQLPSSSDHQKFFNPVLVQ